MQIIIGLIGILIGILLIINKINIKKTLMIEICMLLFAFGFSSGFLY
jgi:hypothetical protein